MIPRHVPHDANQTGISALELSRRLDVSYNTAWAMHHKLRQVMPERNQGKPLDGRIEMDDADLGGERSGGKRGRGSPGKTPFVAAVETTADGKAHRVKVRRVRRFTKNNIKKITRRIVTLGARVFTARARSSTSPATTSPTASGRGRATSSPDSFGRQTELEVQQKLGREIDYDRFTRLDRTLLAEAEEGRSICASARVRDISSALTGTF